jgi:hypothetical protein
MQAHLAILTSVDGSPALGKPQKQTSPIDAGSCVESGFCRSFSRADFLPTLKG